MYVFHISFIGLYQCPYTLLSIEFLTLSVVGSVVMSMVGQQSIISSARDIEICKHSYTSPSSVTMQWDFSEYQRFLKLLIVVCSDYTKLCILDLKV